MKYVLVLRLDTAPATDYTAYQRQQKPQKCELLPYEQDAQKPLNTAQSHVKTTEMHETLRAS